ncbi:MAG: LSU ribosomal protein L10P [Candidatus Methanoperedens nitroreducens]|uniref:Large ribosomal subunit protein uL10 n=1 Tax=Candidatus Methanoperedens nitratireducens TaxID=1392998 RepID=A0A0P8C798_9EURY|nr:50S ribosomal protein L10 [Candidatus Methanoperedens sp. BLZ2]KAB2942446.1 MAG: 50S ribosomal protein L10 [Candidatus Methanoperedens sp.]KPQ42628.1 MAG: LSU ribosomal protein L10P [Candidatus Methanoperedens sp. BLZ1]MBZ0177131.1 50S ribosomal protein L10 [Candidatus Methanoperedens nitroreducens]MCX9077562.1 50S ribosomal protein L10 [Candidatus Methanoperedens sp.]
MSTELVHHSIHIPKWKKDEIEDIKRLITTHSSVGIVGVTGIPSNQLQLMRKSLRGIADLKMCRNSLIDRALAESSDEVKQINKYVEDQTALLFTNENPFKLFKILDKGKTSAPMKPGGIAPKDIVVEKGPTSFPPGPIVGELTGAGIPAGIEGGKVVIRQTKTVAKKGDVVDAKLASILSRLEIHPMELGLDLRAVYENGMIYESKILSVDETTYTNNLTLAVQHAFNLSVNSAYPAKATISTLLTKAASQSRNLAINAEIMMPEIIDVLLGKANAQMMSIARLAMAKDANSVSSKIKEKVAAAPK